MSGNSYWEEIERYFVKKRGNALILSPKDWPLVTAWQERGIPLDVIYEGIDKAFMRFEAQQPSHQRQAARTLASCQYDVEDVWNARKKARPETPPSRNEDTPKHMTAECRKISTKLRSIAKQLSKYAEKPLYHCIHDELLASSEMLGSLSESVKHAADEPAVDQLKHQIREIEKNLISRLEQAIDDAVRQQLYAQVDAQLTAYKQNMKAEVYQETLRIAFLQALRQAYPLPSFL